MSLKNKNVFITGISGFVGSRMAKHLLDEGANVVGLVRRRADGSIPENIKYLGIEKEIILVEGDVRDISSVAIALDQAKPDVIFHLAAQSFIPRSFCSPSETMDVNCQGTTNLLEAIRSKGLDPVIVFAGSSEEYGLVFFSRSQYEQIKNRYGTVFPEPTRIPELPITESNPLRPMSPYAVSKVYADYLMRNYHTCFGLKTIVSRGFNQEGAGRGKMFVTSAITRQIMQYKRGEVDKLVIGNVSAFRDWSHINDALRGYCLLAEKARYGDVYNQGSQRTNSVLSYLLLSLECAGYAVERVETLNGNKVVHAPNELDDSEMFGLRFEKTKVDRLMLEGKLEFHLADIGIAVITDKGKIIVEFDKEKFRPADVPLLLSRTAKIEQLGFQVQKSLKDIIRDQLNYFLDPAR
ncbi:MAG TPA: SDR family oxidoreductase [Dehalococcoidia bacterium]|nr:SDR family oxidoreductase [Dehalococcoidia bacterium]